MNTDSNSVMRNKWKQVCLGSERDVTPTQGNTLSKSGSPVSGILFENTSHSVFRSFAGIISALPEQNRAVIPHTWRVVEIACDRVPFDGERLSSLGFPVAKQFRIKPFARILNQEAQDVVIAIKPELPDCILNKVVSPDEFCIRGISYRQRKDTVPSTGGFEFLNWTENQVTPHSYKGNFTSFIVRVEESIRISFWGAPILTPDGEISMIVVYQRNLAEGEIAIVGMKIHSFMAKIPYYSALCTQI